MDAVAGKAKKAVLEQIMQMMDERMGEGLKSKSPKFAAVEIEAKPEEMEEEKPSMDEMMAKEESEEMKPDSESMDDDDMERLKRLYEELA